MEQGTNSTSTHGGGTETAGAMPVGRARPHGEVPAQCTPEARNWNPGSQHWPFFQDQAHVRSSRATSFKGAWKWGHWGTERVKMALLPHCPGAKEASQILGRRTLYSHYPGWMWSNFPQPSHAGIQNSIYFDLKGIKGSFISFTQGSVD